MAKAVHWAKLRAQAETEQCAQLGTEAEQCTQLVAYALN